LEEAGVHVVYGLVGLKTHSKIAMVIRQEEDGIRRYLHLATGNYNSSTAKIYEDIGMFTCDPVMGEEVSDLFNYLTGYATQQDYQKLLVAPVNLRQRLTALIERESALVKAGKAGHIIMKVNSIVDPAMIIDLYRASQAGVKIDLFVRGMCCLKPGVDGVSENIRVTSIVGRFLEHSRVYYFGNDGKPEVYVGSADVMQRNLDHRVEVVFPVERLEHIKYFESFLLANYQKDNHRARVMHANGKYTRVKPEKGVAAFDIQQFLMENAP
jgi:polyphosphate kinase